MVQPAKLAFMERCEREFPLGRFRIYYIPMFVVSDPELVSEVLARVRGRAAPDNRRTRACLSH